ncbi:hypothetical protein [Micromonospora sp. LOL_023]|uniref:hypothetical protein n=1 Tax=Micromonospora sp. LOL_023 TaxID=3345418 RepID=UPI003A87F9EE
MPVSPVIEVAQLHVTYGKFYPVEEISTQVARREPYALFGKGPTAQRSVRPRMGMLRQESGFAADLTVAGVSGNDRRQSRTEV